MSATLNPTPNPTATPTKKPGHAAWFTELTPPERSTFIATFGGWALDGMDVMVYSFVIPGLIAAWHITKGEAGMLGTAALLISAVGGWLAGLLADRFGRTRVLQWTILWFALFTFLSGFTNNFWQLLFTRGCQGLGFGGEWAVGSVLMGETIRAEHRGKAVGTVQGGWAIGWGIAAICSVALFSWLPAGLAWRAMFWIGILPAFLVFYIRRHVEGHAILYADVMTDSMRRALSETGRRRQTQLEYNERNHITPQSII